MTKEQTLEAAEVMKRAAEGEIVEIDTGVGWVLALDIRWDWGRSNYRILDFPDPPPNRQWHNPAGLNATQVGVHEGWRLLLESECTGNERRFDLESNFGNDHPWTGMGREFFPNRTMICTCRTKSPLPEAKADPMDESWKRFCSESGERQGKLPTGQFLNLCGIDFYKSAWNACKEHYGIP